MMYDNISYKPLLNETEEEMDLSSFSKFYRQITNRKLNLRCRIRLKSSILIISLLVLLFFLSIYYFDSPKCSISNFNGYSSSNLSPNYLSKYGGSNIGELWRDYFPGFNPNNLKCSEFFNNNKTAMKQYSDCGRLTIFEDHQLDMDCNSVRRRVMGNNVYSKLNQPIVIIRNIYTSYPMQEAFMSLSYHPENSYCFVMDSKSNATFTYKMNKLARCFDNIYISDKTYDLDSSGHYQDYAHFECLKILLEKDKNWNHALLLQNYDLIIKTPSELSRISEIFNGTHIFGLRGPASFARYDRYANWSAKGLKIWKNESGKSALQLKSSLSLGDGYNEVFVSRNLIQAMFDELNIDNLLKRFNDLNRFGIDEQFLQTMIINSWLGLPGQLPYHCERRLREFGRYSHFHNGWLEIFRRFDLYTTLYDGCKSRRSRHSVCLMGVEYLPRLGEMEHLLGNKPHPEFDFGTIMCMGEYLHDIEFGKRTRHINWALYENSVQVRQTKLVRDGKFDIRNFTCYPPGHPTRKEMGAP